MSVRKLVESAMVRNGVPSDAVSLRGELWVCSAVWVDQHFTVGWAWSVQTSSDGCKKWCDDIETAHPGSVCCKWRLFAGSGVSSLYKAPAVRCVSTNPGADVRAVRTMLWLYVSFAVEERLRHKAERHGDDYQPLGDYDIKVGPLGVEGVSAALETCKPLSWVPDIEEATSENPPTDRPVYRAAVEPFNPVAQSESAADPFVQVRSTVALSRGPNGTDRRGRGVKVAVLDTGINPSHPAFAGKSVRFADATGAGRSASDGNGHGTWCCGAVFGRTAADSANPFEGMAPDADATAIAVLTAAGWGTDEMIARGMDIARNLGVDVISMSLGGPEPSDVTARAVKACLDAGIIVVAAAGNDGPDGGVGYPGGYQGVFTVAACDFSDPPKIAQFSSRGPEVDITAPGVSIRGPWLGGWQSVSGTSMATPIVAGSVCAILGDDRENFRIGYIPSRIESTARKLPGYGPESQGKGLVQVNPVLATPPTPTPTPTPNPDPTPTPVPPPTPNPTAFNFPAGESGAFYAAQLANVVNDIAYKVFKGKDVVVTVS